MLSAIFWWLQETGQFIFMLGLFWKRASEAGALTAANAGYATSYGDDPWTDRACGLLRDFFETDCEVFFVFTGKLNGGLYGVMALHERYSQRTNSFLVGFSERYPPFDFDLVKATEQSRENPVWYVQYCHARTRSVLRQAAAAGVAIDGLDSAPFDRLGDAGELALVRLIAQWPRQVEAAAAAREAAKPSSLDKAVQSATRSAASSVWSRSSWPWSC